MSDPLPFSPRNPLHSHAPPPLPSDPASSGKAHSPSLFHHFCIITAILGLLFLIGSGVFFWQAQSSWKSAVAQTEKSTAARFAGPKPNLAISFIRAHQQLVEVHTQLAVVSATVIDAYGEVRRINLLLRNRANLLDTERHYRQAANNVLMVLLAKPFSQLKYREIIEKQTE